MKSLIKTVSLITAMFLFLCSSSCKSINTNKSVETESTIKTTSYDNTIKIDNIESQSVRKNPSPDEFPNTLSFSAEDLTYFFEDYTFYEGLEFNENEKISIDDISFIFYQDKINKGTDENGVSQYNYMEYAVKDKTDNKLLVFNIPVDIVMDYFKSKFNVVEDVTTSIDYNKSKNTFTYNVYTNEQYEGFHTLFLNNTKKVSDSEYSIEYDIYSVPDGDSIITKMLTRQIVVEIKNNDYKYLSAKTLKVWNK